jgi:hypothetical protein
MVYLRKRKKAAVYKTRPIMPRAEATADAGGAADGKARSTEAQTNTRGSNISLDPNLPGQNSRESFFRRRFKNFLGGLNKFKKKIGLNKGQPATSTTTTTEG